MTKRDLITAAVGGLIAVALAGGASWAAIGDTGTIQACYDSAGNLKVVSSLPCPRNQTLLEWNREGPKGTDGRNGTNGRDGKDGEDGVSVASVALSKGDDANCPEGGSRFTAVNGVSTYACNGRDGAAGVGSLDALQGAPCNNGAGDAQISYASNGSVSLKCLVTRTLTVATSSTLGANGTVTSAPAGISCPGTAPRRLN
jgi:hypothetical protein